MKKTGFLSETDTKSMVIPDCYRLTELGPMPQEWRVVKLGDLWEQRVLWIKNGFPQGSFNEQGRGVPHLRPFNVNENGEIALAEIKYVPPASGQGYWLQKGDILFNNTNSEELVGKVAYFEHEGLFTLSNHMTIIRVQEPSMVDRVWLASWLLYLWHRGFTQRLARRHVNQASVSLARLRDIPIPLPPLPEQRAIAHVLRAVQRAREATERVIAALRELKKSLMRHLFTYGPVPVDAADQVPMQETDIGPIPAHWRVVRLGEVTRMKQGKVLPVSSFTGHSFPVFGANGQIGWHSEYTHEEPEVVVTCRGATCGTVHVTPPKVFITNNAMVVTPLLDSNLSKLFLAYALMVSDLQKAVTGTGQPQITKATLSMCAIPLPPLPQQHEIARILQTVDRKLEAEEARKQALGALFKTLLHELMTARRRLPREFVARFEGDSVASRGEDQEGTS